MNRLDDVLGILDLIVDRQTTVLLPAEAAYIASLLRAGRALRLGSALQEIKTDYDNAVRGEVDDG